MKNRLKYWRHQLLIDTQTEYAKLLGVRHQQISLWEKQKQQPTLETLVKLWLILRTLRPDLNLQDLIELED